MKSIDEIRGLLEMAIAESTNDSLRKFTCDMDRTQLSDVLLANLSACIRGSLLNDALSMAQLSNTSEEAISRIIERFDQLAQTIRGAQTSVLREALRDVLEDAYAQLRVLFDA